ncbi:hypothetical protein [Winogradskyella sediminis]|uniref:hypothetical protein n=1 Tax=Winogradskyella sediminis TaxID=1382466 RepID=UPI003AA8FCD1
MNRKQSILLDILLEEFTKSKYEKFLGMVDDEKLKNGNEKIKKLKDSEFRKLIYIIKIEQVRIGFVLVGNDSSFLPQKQRIKDFLNAGGFKKRYREKLFNDFIKYIIPLITLGILIYVHFIKELDLEPKTIIEKNTKSKELLLKEQTSTKKLDFSTLKQKDLSEQDSLKNQTDSLNNK